MSTEPYPSQDGPREQDQQPHDEPNEFGFAGAATAPQPEGAHREGDGESVAVPAGDITGAVTQAIEEATERDRG